MAETTTPQTPQGLLLQLYHHPLLLLREEMDDLEVPRARNSWPTRSAAKLIRSCTVFRAPRVDSSTLKANIRPPLVCATQPN